MPPFIRATVLFVIVLTGSAVAFIGAGTTARTMAASNPGASHRIAVLADAPGPEGSGNATCDGFTWG